MSQSQYWFQKSHFYDIHMSKYGLNCLLWTYSMSSIYVIYVCILCMYSICILCMYFDEAQDAKPEFRFFKIALNRVLTLPDCRSRRQLSESVFRSQKSPLGVELWSFYCKKRISVPMSYITFLHSSICLQNAFRLSMKTFKKYDFA